LQWQEVGDLGFRLVEYPTLSPDSSQYRALLPPVILTLVLVTCLLPVALACYLLLQHRTGAIEAAKLSQRCGQVQPHQLTTRRTALLLQLTAMYRPQCWWMAAFLLLRRLCLLAVLTFVRSSVVWMWLTLLNYSFLALHLLVQPFDRRRDNDLETLMLFSLSVQTSLLSIWPPPYTSPALLSAFDSLVVGPLLPPLLLHLALVSRCRTANRSRRGPGLASPSRSM
jgi:hypothetical protein